MNTADRLAHYAQRHAAGFKAALLDAIALCADTGTPIPGWASAELLRIQREIIDGHKIDLNTEFGLSPIADPRSRSRRYTIATMAAEVGNAILRASRQGTAIDNELLQHVGDDLGLPLARVRECWAACKAEAQRRGIPIEAVGEFSGLISPT